MGAIWALLELAATALTMIQGGLRSILSPSFLDPEMLRLQAIWTAALGALLCGFIGRRSIRWWRHATVTMWVGLLELILAVGIAFMYVTQVPEASVVDLFRNEENRGIEVKLCHKRSKFLAFDVFGTVVDWRSSVIAEGEQLGKSERIANRLGGFRRCLALDLSPVHGSRRERTITLDQARRSASIDAGRNPEEVWYHEPHRR